MFQPRMPRPDGWARILRTTTGPFNPSKGGLTTSTRSISRISASLLTCRVPWARLPEQWACNCRHNSHRCPNCPKFLRRRSKFLRSKFLRRRSNCPKFLRRRSQRSCTHRFLLNYLHRLLNYRNGPTSQSLSNLRQPHSFQRQLGNGCVLRVRRRLLLCPHHRLLLCPHLDMRPLCQCPWRSGRSSAPMTPTRIRR